MADTQNQKYKPEENRPLYQMFLQLAKLSEIIGQILQGLYTTRAKQQSYIQGSDNLVTRLDHELTIWRFGLIKVLQETDTTQQNELNLTPVAGRRMSIAPLTNEEQVVNQILGFVSSQHQFTYAIIQH